MAHDAFEVAAVVDRAVGSPVGKGLARHEVAAAQRDPVDAVLGGGVVDQPLDDEGDVGAACAAIGRHRHRVGVHQARAHVQGGHPVDAAHGDRQVAGADQAAPVAAVGAEVGLVLEAQREDVAVGVERDRALQRQRAAMPFADEELGAGGDPLDRPAEAARREHHEHLLGEGAAADAEAAADVLRHHLDRLRPASR